MIQRGIGILVGALVSLVLLMLMVNGVDGVDWNEFVIPLVVGGIVAFFWPVIISFWLGRRARRRRDARIESEVQRQLEHDRRG